MRLTAASVGTCSMVEKLESTCSVSLGNFGQTNIISVVNPCVDPPELDVTVQVRSELFLSPFVRQSDINCYSRGFIY